MNENKINSYFDAEKFLMNMFGEPDYFSRPEDVTEVEEYLDMYRNEYDELQRYIKNVSFENLNQYKINRNIALHFLLNAGDEYLRILHDCVYSKEYEEQLEALDEVVEGKGYWPEYPDMTDDERNFGNSDYWDRP